MKLFHILLILAVAIIGVFADDQCIVNCVEYGAADCYVGSTNYQCVCNNFKYQSDTIVCTAQYCGYQDVAVLLNDLAYYCTTHG
ncbi:hypothetical protein BGW80DRAFT_1459154 [Lactifluus volemus]|nr:hypothetical protein BGW80DRAFT_1459154 [Lactifluus volemus]